MPESNFPGRADHGKTERRQNQSKIFFGLALEASGRPGADYWRGRHCHAPPSNADGLQKLGSDTVPTPTKISPSGLNPRPRTRCLRFVITVARVLPTITQDSPRWRACLPYRSGLSPAGRCEKVSTLLSSFPSFARRTPVCVLPVPCFFWSPMRLELQSRRAIIRKQNAVLHGRAVVDSPQESAIR